MPGREHVPCPTKASRHARITSPDGDSYGSRWSRATRETTGSRRRPVFTTPAGVADQIPGSVNCLRDRCRGRKMMARRRSGGLALRARPPATIRVAIRRRKPQVADDAMRLADCLLRRHECRVIGLRIDHGCVGRHASLSADYFDRYAGVVHVGQAHRFQELRVLDELVGGEVDLG
jgi:hypothetical protein